MKKKNIILLILMCYCIFIQSCVEPFNLKEQVELNVINVNGILSNIPEENYVNVSTIQALYNGSKSLIEPIKGAIVNILGTDGTITKCNNYTSNPLFYIPENNFVPKPNISYNLEIKLPDGTEIVSKKESLPIATTLVNIADQLEIIPVGVANYAKHNLKISFTDPEEKNTYFKWIFTAWEKKQICKTCEGNTAFRALPNPSFCRRLPFSFPVIPYYDYECGSLCFEKIEFDPLTIYSDVYTNGQQINNLTLGSFPFYEFSPVSVNVKQMSISYAAFRYNETLKNLGKNTGTLADTPPEPIIGNVYFKVIKNKAVISGYFYVTNIAQKNHLINREITKEIIPSKVLGRVPVFEPTALDVPGSAPCIESRFTTNKKPSNWPY